MKKIGRILTTILHSGIQPLTRLGQVIPSSHYILLSALFFFGLEMMVAFNAWLIPITLTLFALLLYGIVLIRYEEKKIFHPTQAFLPILTATGLTGFALFFQIGPLIHLYFLFASAVFFWLLKHGAKAAYPTWNWGISLVVYLLNTAVIFGLRANLYTPALLILIMVFIVTFLIASQAVRRLTPNLQHAIFLGLAIGLVHAQVAWALLFLPIHFLVQAGVLLVVYYTIFHTLEKHMLGTLTKPKLIEYLFLGTLGLLVLLLSTDWI